MPELDHLVYGVPVLLDGVAELADRTGLTPVAGGRHIGRGTANYLLGLGPGRYLEIIGPDPESPGAAGQMPFGVGTLSAPRLLTWCVRPSDLDQCLLDARGRGYDPGNATAMSRRTTDGALLSWRLTPDSVDSDGGLVPFLIDWQDSPHPSTTGLPEARLISLTATSPDPARIARTLSTIGLILHVETGPHPVLTAVLDTPRGEVVL